LRDVASPYNAGVSDGRISLDHLAHDIVGRSGFRFTVADDGTRELAYQLRYRAVVDHRMEATEVFPDGRERDSYDDRAIHIIGWDADTPIATGRIVLPPGPLPTEKACGFTVDPCGRVADVGRMTVARTHQGPGAHSTFLALLARLYLEVRAQHFEFACGVMSPRARSLMRLLGLHVEVLGNDRPYWGELRAPVRFALTIDASPIATRLG